MARRQPRSGAPRIVNVSSTTASLTLTAGGKDLPGDADVRLAYASSKAALNMLGHRVGGLRLPLVEADAGETQAVAAALEASGILASA